MLTTRASKITHVLRPDLQGVLLIVVTLFLVAAVYLGRSELDGARAAWEMGPGPGGLIFVCLFFSLFPILILYLIWLLAYTFMRRRPLPALVLLVGLALALLLPAPPMYEEALFLSNRPHYERLVQLARGGQLEHSQKCDRHWFSPPAAYEHLAPECIIVSREEAFTVEFKIRGYYRRLVYVEDRSTLTYHHACGWPDGRILRQFDANWYICQEDFN